MNSSARQLEAFDNDSLDAVSLMEDIESSQAGAIVRWQNPLVANTGLDSPLLVAHKGLRKFGYRGLASHPYFSDQQVLRELDGLGIINSEIRDRLIQGVVCVDTFGKSLAYLPNVEMEWDHEVHAATDACEHHRATASTSIDLINDFLSRDYSLWRAELRLTEGRGRLQRPNVCGPWIRFTETKPVYDGTGPLSRAEFEGLWSK